MKNSIKQVSVFIVALCFSSLGMAQDWANLGRYAAANAELKAPSSKENRVVFMGNSITDNWIKYDSTFFQLNPYICRGISGQVTSQMLLRFRPDVIELQPKVVVILAGTNDIAENKGPITLEQIAGNLFSMAELAKANNIKVVLCTVLPAISYSWRPDIEPANLIVDLNKLIKAYAKKNNIILCDFYSPMVNENKGLKKEYGRDTVHPCLVGYRIMDTMIQASIKKALKRK